MRYDRFNQIVGFLLLSLSALTLVPRVELKDVAAEAQDSGAGDGTHTSTCYNFGPHAQTYDHSVLLTPQANAVFDVQVTMSGGTPVNPAAVNDFITTGGDAGKVLIVYPHPEVTLHGLNCSSDVNATLLNAARAHMTDKDPNMDIAISHGNGASAVIFNHAKQIDDITVDTFGDGGYAIVGPGGYSALNTQGVVDGSPNDTDGLANGSITLEGSNGGGLGEIQLLVDVTGVSTTSYGETLTYTMTPTSEF